MAKIKLVLDTNIYISAILFGGIPEEILELARSSLIEVYISPAITAEITEVLRQKFGWGVERRREVLAELGEITRSVQSSNKTSIIKDDEADNRVLEAATSARADFIISGDEHLLRLERFEKAKIVSPRQFIELMSSKVNPHTLEH